MLSFVFTSSDENDAIYCGSDAAYCDHLNYGIDHRLSLNPSVACCEETPIFH